MLPMDRRIEESAEGFQRRSLGLDAMQMHQSTLGLCVPSSTFPASTPKPHILRDRNRDGHLNSKAAYGLSGAFGIGHWILRTGDALTIVVISFETRARSTLGDSPASVRAQYSSSKPTILASGHGLTVFTGLLLSRGRE